MGQPRISRGVPRRTTVIAAAAIFDTSHLGMLAVCGLLIAATALIARHLRPEQRPRAALALGLVMLVQEIVERVLTVTHWGGAWQDELPLHMCGVSIVLAIVAVLSSRLPQWAFECCYYWGIGGATQAILTPSVPESFPHPVYILYFTSHAAILVGVAWAIAAWDKRPEGWRSLARILLYTNILAVAVTPFNLLLDANYLFLRSKPAGPTLFDQLGPWPWYIASLELVLLAVCALCYLPWAVLERRRRSAAP